MRSQGISRGRFLALAGAAGGAATAGALLGAGPATATVPAPAGPGSRASRGLTYRGVCYEVGEASREAGWTTARMRADLTAVRNDLHANSVSVWGDGVEDLAATASEAAQRGLHVWLQPRLGDRPESEILDHLAETGRHAERLRRNGAKVHLSVGCEFVLYVPGIVPGADAVERIENILKGNYDPEQMSLKLEAFIARAAAVGRSVFRGSLTYGASFDEEVDWKLFDVVSANYYGYHPDRAAYVRDLKPLQRWGKPVAISECGSCTYVGAPEQGGMGWYDVIDDQKTPPEIKGGLVRSERTQAAYLSEVFDVFESMNLYAGMVFNFVSPELPHVPDALHDLDIVSYSLVKTIQDRPHDPTSDWHWEPKESFRALAQRFERARRCH
ncbi:abortive phage infection protein [Streptomyces sp. NPDC057702]|uniref:abortive phage infection protein n=1 Tax=unclassified Streptomyces TaxID=2593676 RepID=UPI0036B8B8E7